ncbi:MAG: translation initiation factor [Verrucomicrobiota bacterium]
MGKKDRKKGKLDLNPSTGSGLNNAFGQLDLDGLPDGPVLESAQETTETEDKLTHSESKKGRVVLRRETAHRGGKSVVIVSGLEEMPETDLQALAHDLKRSCGTGGTVKDGEIIIQGEKALELSALLRKRGYQVAGVTK